MKIRGTSGGGVRIHLDDDETEALKGWVEQLAELVAPDEAESSDPLATMVGLGADREPSGDPALQRLFPDAYLDDDEAASDFRRYTEQDLRKDKAQRAAVVIATLGERSGRKGTVTLDADQARAWLGCLNDLRLVIGTRIGVTEDDQWPDEDDPRTPVFFVYHWLTYLQGTLVDAMSPRSP
ncbi:MAG: DUF2017 domain-containing protein [Actinomycetes bacterium]